MVNVIKLGLLFATYLLNDVLCYPMKQIYCGFHQFLFFILTAVRLKLCVLFFFFLRKNIKEYFKIVVCTFFFLSPSVFPFFFQRNGDSQGQRLCLGTGHLPPTFASVAQAC